MKDLKNKYEYLIKKHIGLIPYDEQYRAAKEIIKGNVVEMKTGEGKTIVAIIATMALVEKGRKVYICTSNDYLSKRDYEYSKALFSEMGIKSIFLEEGIGGSDYIYDEYNVFFAQGSTLIFDFLRGKKAKYDIAIIDEIDHVLVERANHNYCVSDSKNAVPINTPYFRQALSIAEIFSYKEIPTKYKKEDYLFDFQWEADVLTQKEKKSFELTERGLQRLSEIMQDEKICENIMFMEILNAAINANLYFQRDVNYIIQGGEIVIIEEANGRISSNSKTDIYLQSVVEIKEGIDLTPKSLYSNTCSFPVFFSLFNIITGMSGSVSCFEKDFEIIYKKKIVKIKEHFPNARKLHYEYYETDKEKLERIKEIVESNINNPILIVADSDKRADILHSYLNIERARILTNSNLHEEKELIEKIRKSNCVLISDKIVGRGMDINPEKVNSMLIVIIAQRFFDCSVEIQAIGRTGRNGNKGCCYVLTSGDEIICKGLKSKSSDRVIEKLVSSNQKAYGSRMFEARKNIYIESKLLFDHMLAIKGILKNFGSFSDIRDFVDDVNILENEQQKALLIMIDRLIDEKIPYTNVCEHILLLSFEEIKKIYQEQFKRYASLMMNQLKQSDGFYDIKKDFILAGKEIIVECITILVAKYHSML